MKAMLRSAAAFAGDGWDVLLDFSIPPAFAAGAAARMPDADLRYVELRASLAICAERAARRAEGVIADYEPYADLYAMFAADERFALHTDDASPEEVAVMIRSGMAAGQFRLV
jgi:hypothetical protein